MVDLAQQPMFGRLQFPRPARVRHIDLGREIINDPPGVVAHGADVQLVPERGAVLSVIEQFDGEAATLGDGGPKLGDGLDRGVRPLQEAAVAPDDLGVEVTGEIQECLVGQHDGIVGLTGVRDDDGHSGPFEGDGRQLPPIDHHLGRRRARQVTGEVWPRG
jgi:hypothetical protein